MRALLATTFALAFAALCLAGTASAAPPVGGCNAVTNPCWNGALVCVGISQQVPVCVKDPGIVQGQDVCVTQAYSTHGDAADCGGIVCVGYGADGWVKCYGHPIPQCINICI
jgi:hypothetical protein